MEPTEPSPNAAPSPAVIATLVDNHRQFLEFLERRVGDRALAEDILQEAFVRGVTRLETLRDEESVVAWFYRVLRNSVTDHHRRHATNVKKLAALAQEVQAPEPPAEWQASVCQCVGHLATTLKPEFSEALLRIELDGISVKDYAAEAGISRSNAAVRIFRAREALKQQVSRACGTCAEHGCLDCSCGPPDTGRSPGTHCA